jgi:serine protease Do
MKNQESKIKLNTIALVVVSVFLGVLLAAFYQMNCNGDKFDLHATKTGPLSSKASNVKATEIQTAFNEIFKAVSPAIVSISTEQNVKMKSPFFSDPFFRHFFGNRTYNRKQAGLGSGFIINKYGYIVTNHHVAGEVDKIIVTLNNGKSYPAKLIGTDPQSDIALMKIESEESLPYVFIGNSDTVKVGDWSIALGNPFGLSHTFTVGVISATAREDITGNDFVSYIQTDASINPGNSGGPLINIQGQVIGINRMIYSQSGGSIGIGFAIPINDAKIIIEELRKNRKIVRGWLGVQIAQLSESEKNKLGLKNNVGVLIDGIYPDSPAKKAGLKPADVILSIDGKDIKEFNDLKITILKAPVGKKVNINILRKGKKKSVKVKIEEMPN